MHRACQPADLKRGRMPPRVCDRKTPSDVARRLAVLRLASGCKDTSSKQSEQKVNTALIGWSCRPWFTEELSFGGALSHS